MLPEKLDYVLIAVRENTKISHPHAKRKKSPPMGVTIPNEVNPVRDIVNRLPEKVKIPIKKAQREKRIEGNTTNNKLMNRPARE